MGNNLAASCVMKHAYFNKTGMIIYQKEVLGSIKLEQVGTYLRPWSIRHFMWYHRFLGVASEVCIAYTASGYNVFDL